MKEKADRRYKISLRGSLEGEDLIIVTHQRASVHVYSVIQS